MDMEHVERRRNYVQDIRKSFDTPKSGNPREKRAETAEGANRYSFIKVRLLIALFIFAAFVLCDQTNTLFYSHTTTDIIKKIETNYDYSSIENYVMTLAQKR